MAHPRQVFIRGRDDLEALKKKKISKHDGLRFTLRTPDASESRNNRLITLVFVQSILNLQKSYSKQYYWINLNIAELENYASIHVCVCVCLGE